jgi:Mor family transcriptional regulator
VVPPRRYPDRGEGLCEMTASVSLPNSLLDVADTFGLGVVVKLMQHFGGQEVEFPLRPRPGHELISVLGEEQANALCHFMSGQRVYVPHGKSRRLPAEVTKLENTGLARREIARRLGISQRHVRRLANAPPPALPLFPDHD